MGGTKDFVRGTFLMFNNKIKNVPPTKSYVPPTKSTKIGTFLSNLNPPPWMFPILFQLYGVFVRGSIIKKNVKIWGNKTKKLGLSCVKLSRT